MSGYSTSNTSRSRNAARSSGASALERGEKRDGDVRCQIRSVVRTWQPFGDERFRQPRSRIRLALGAQRPQPVDAQPRRRRHEPSLRRANLLCASVVPAQIGVLHDILGIGARPEHAVGDTPEPVALFDEGDASVR